MFAPSIHQDFVEAEEFPDDRLLQMLQDAEQRLRDSQHSTKASLVPSSDDNMNLATPQTRISTGDAGVLLPYVKSADSRAQIEPSLMMNSEQRKLANQFRVVNDSSFKAAKIEKEKPANAGSDWYDMPRTDLTPELKRDLQLLKMRAVLDPKRHYKKDARRDHVPEFSQVGTVIEGPTEFFSARLTNKERKQTLVEEVLEGEKISQRFKSKYRDIQKAKTSGRKDHYKALKAKRKSKY